MSKYSTEELVKGLGGIVPRGWREFPVFDAIVARLRSADKVISLAIKPIGHLGLWDDKEFYELSKAIDKYEEGK